MGNSQTGTPPGGSNTELFMQLFAKNGRRVRAFLYNLIPRPEEVDAVMREFSLFGAALAPEEIADFCEEGRP